jgi:hypothetical protein
VSAPATARWSAVFLGSFIVPYLCGLVAKLLLPLDSEATHRVASPLMQQGACHEGKPLFYRKKTPLCLAMDAAPVRLADKMSYVSLTYVTFFVVNL